MPTARAHIGVAARRCPLSISQRAHLALDRVRWRAPTTYTLIGTTKLNNIDPQAWIAEGLDRISGTPQGRLHELLP